ncbi:MAG: hypothetical protein ACI4KM_07675 [Oscillospiraceae bacterium]
MDFIPLLIGVGMFAVLFVYHAVMTIMCRRQYKKIETLGELKGKSIDEIVDMIGLPDSQMQVSNGKFCQWVQFGYHLSLTFDKEGVCTAVDSMKKNS